WFMWAPDSEQARPENWKHLDLSPNGIETAWQIFTEMPEDCAEVGVHVSEEISLRQLAIIDTLQGLLVHEGIRRAQGEDAVVLPVPCINFIGTSKSIEKAIRWRNHISCARDVLLSWLYS